MQLLLLQAELRAKKMEQNDTVDTQPEVDQIAEMSPQLSADQVSWWQLEQLGGSEALEVVMEAGFYTKNVDNVADVYAPTRPDYYYDYYYYYYY